MITKQLMESLFPTEGLKPTKYNLVREREKLIEAMNRILPKYGIVTFLRLIAFLATCGIETDYFKTTAEYASGADYEGRRDLGNINTGDGRKYKGSGLIQTTGRYNFFRVLYRFVKKLTGVDYSDRPEKALTEADRLNVNVIAHPELLRSNIEFAVEAACIFWEENNLNKYADIGTSEAFKQLNGIVNKGSAKATPLHWAKRNELYSKCKRIVPKDISFAPTQAPIVTIQLGDNSTYTTQVVPPVTPSPQPVEPPKAEPATDDFLTTAFDRNVSADVVKTAVPSLAKRFWKFLIRTARIALYGARSRKRRRVARRGRCRRNRRMAYLLTPQRFQAVI